MAFDKVGPLPNGFVSDGPLLAPPETPPPKPCEDAVGFAGSAGCAGFSSTTIPAAFNRFFSSIFAISSGDIVRYCGLFSPESFFLLEEAVGAVLIVAASFCAFSFSTCARIAAINASV